MREPLILLLAALLAFGVTLGASFHFDDYAFLSDPAVTSPSGWWQVWHPMQTRPLTWLTFWLNYQLGGTHPAGYHAANVTIHLAAVAALWCVLRRLLCARAAFVAAALFAVHPLQTEAVAYLFARATLLMTLFCLLALDAWVRGRSWAAVGWFSLGLLSKEECAAFPLFLLLLDFSAGKRPRMPALAVMLALSMAAGARVMWALSHVPQATAGFALDPWTYLASQGWVILRYIRLLILPWGFNFDPDIRIELWWAVVGWLAVAALAGAGMRRFRALCPGFWVLGGLVLLLPSSSFFPAADLAADRRMYLPLAALAAGTGLALQKWRLQALTVLGVLLVGLSVARSQVWLSEESLWHDAVERSPRKVRPKLQLARAVEPVQALGLLEDAKRLAPEDPDVAAHLGRTWLQLSRPERALGEFGRALALAPGDPQALNNRGVALAALGDRKSARQDFERALAANPHFAEARKNLRLLGVATQEPAGSR